jgi:general secretion pathway protein N
MSAQAQKKRGGNAPSNPGGGGGKMIRRRACVIAAMTYFSARVALGQDAAGASGSDETGPTPEPQLTTAENPGLRQPPPQGNPLSRIPINSLSATRERPLFSASRRPPLPVPAPLASIAKSSPPAELERPPLTLQGTGIGKPRDIALVLDETAKGSVKLHVGEAAEGWYLRSVDHRTVTLEKDSRIVVLSLPAPGAAPPSPSAFASDRSDQFCVRPIRPT